MTNGRKPGIYKWFKIQDSTDYYKLFESPKLPGIIYKHGASFAMIIKVTTSMHLALFCQQIAKRYKQF